MNFSLSKFLSLLFYFGGCVVASSFQGCGKVYPTQTTPVSANALMALKYSADGSKLAGVDVTGTVFVLDTKTGQVLSRWVLPYSADKVAQKRQGINVHFSADGGLVYACTLFTNRVEISGWDLNDSNPKVALFTRPFHNFCDIGIMGDFMISDYNQDSPASQVTINDIKTGQELFAIHSPNEDFSYGIDSSYVLLISMKDHRREIWDINGQKKIFDRSNVVIYSTSLAKNLVLFANGSDYESASKDELFLWDVQKNQVIQTFHMPTPFVEGILSAVLSSDGNRLLITGKTGAQEYTWFLWDITSDAPRMSKKIADSNASPDVWFLPSHSNRILTSYRGLSQSQLWNADTGNLVESFAIRGSNVSEPLWFVLSPDGTQLAGPSFANDGQIFMWDLIGI